MERGGERADASERGGGGGRRERERERKGEGEGGREREAGRVRARPGPGGLRASSPERERVGGEVGHVPSSRCGRGHSQAPALGVAREGTLTPCSTSCPARRAIVRGW